VKLGLAVVIGALAAGAARSGADAGPNGHLSDAPRVVIDPGHGGSNPGARGAADLFEKQVTLDLSLRVQKRLLAAGDDVRLTRDRDRTLTLRQRVAAANQWPADILVSIHANASPTRTQRGFETFVLDPAGIEIDARALRSDTPTPRPGVPDDIALVLDDVERGAAQWEAADLAAGVQRALRDVRGAAGDRGVRQDAHHVLLGATMPAVLVEVGFIDHPIEGAELADPAVRDRIADAIADAITGALAPDE
jgi:N-acetylmuramoyl-L-alanine amidase